MAVTSLTSFYRDVTSHETMFHFFDTFDFHDMKQEKRKTGENNVNTSVLHEAYVQRADCINICNQTCLLDNWRRNFGYYKLDNAVKYSIYQNPRDNCIYAKGAHFGWGKVNPTDLNDFHQKTNSIVKG